MFMFTFTLRGAIPGTIRFPNLHYGFIVVYSYAFGFPGGVSSPCILLDLRLE
jgi:hypothetical protein